MVSNGCYEQTETGLLQIWPLQPGTILLPACARLVQVWTKTQVGSSNLLENCYTALGNALPRLSATELEVRTIIGFHRVSSFVMRCFQRVAAVKKISTFCDFVGSPN